MFGRKDKSLTPLVGRRYNQNFREYTQTLTPSWESALYLRICISKYLQNGATYLYLYFGRLLSYVYIRSYFEWKRNTNEEPDNMFNKIKCPLIGKILRCK